ncbi:MAG: TetR/AcrR family transcriptional regulator [Dethiobacter sp.]|jgi:TetR/AcrR family fatty acid metabolism transcriptional regulator|nr:MAG: TetR/AcrR family transcriptional regulator [Dethiobacter sp.]
MEVNMNEVLRSLPQQGDKKNRILEAARYLFGEKGYENTTMLQIAKAADVAIGTIYEYFENKEVLFFSIAAERYEAFDKELKIHLSGLKSAFSRIRKYIWFYFYFFQKDPVYSELWLLNIRVNKRLNESTVYPWLQQSGAEIIDMLKAGQAEGMIREDVDLYTVRHLILGSLEHVVTRWLLKGKTYDILPYSEKISDLIIEAIRKKPATEER